MGNRALVQFKCNDDFSPVVYLHWHGYKVNDWLDELKILMGDRAFDVNYTYARFIGICHTNIEGNLSLGAWNSDKLLTASDTHGDEGCFLVDVKTWKIERLG